MATASTLIKSPLIEAKCAFCGYDEHKIALTAHHLFQKSHFKKQPKFRREFRYIILCPTCHFLLHQCIYVGCGAKIITDMISACGNKYKDYRDIDHIIKLVKTIYKPAYNRNIYKS